jgi:RNA polymerase sigma-70 factor (ECF subfamily)
MEVLSEAEELRLLQQAVAGDQQAFEELVERYRPGLRAFIEVRLSPDVRARVDPSDVVQETQLEAFVRLPDFLHRHPMPFHVWLRKTAYERLLKVRRHHVAAQRSVSREVALPDQSSVLLAQRLQANEPGPLQRASQEELASRVQAALAELPDLDREILVMRHVEEFSYEHIGQVLDLEPATARKRYGRALLRLRKTLFPGGTGEEEPGLAAREGAADD